MTAPVVEGTATAATFAGTGGSTLSIPKPSGVANGEKILFLIATRTSIISADITPPSGVSSVYPNIVANGANTHFYEKSITNAGSEPSTYDFVLGVGETNTNWGGSSVRVSNAGSFDTAGATTFTEAGDTSVEFSTITTPEDDCLVFYIAGFDNGRSASTPTGCTQIYDTEELAATKPSFAHAWFYETKATAGTTTTRTSTLSGSARDTLMTIALRPAPVTAFVGWGIPI